MIPILFEAGTTNFETNGLGRLPDCLTCNVFQELNGMYEAEFQYPINGLRYSDIIEGRIIYVSHDIYNDREPFIIYKRSANINGIVTFYAHHISYLLSGIVLRPFTAEGVSGAFEAIVPNSMNTNPFTFSTNSTYIPTISVKVPTTVRAFLYGSDGVLGLTGGEITTSHFNVFLNDFGGVYTGSDVRYGKNMLNIEYDVDYLDTYDSVVPYWVGSDDTVLYGSIITGSGQTRKVVHTLDLSNEYSSPTVATLEQYARYHLSHEKPWLPRQNIELDFVAFERANINRVQLSVGDEVGVYYTAIGVSTKAKVVRLEWDALRERCTKIEVGSLKKSFADTIIDTINNQ